MAYCDNCGNYDSSHKDQLSIDGDYQPDLYYYWDAPLDEDYDWRRAFPRVDCMCEICFDIANSEKKIEVGVPIILVAQHELYCCVTVLF